MFICFIVPDEDPVQVKNVCASEVHKFPKQPGDGQFFFICGLLADIRQRIKAVTGTAPFHYEFGI